MRYDALEEHERSLIAPAVRTILDRYPDGLPARTLRREIHQHPAFDLTLGIQHVHPWLGELCRDDVLVLDLDNGRYVLSEYADEETGSSWRFSD